MSEILYNFAANNASLGDVNSHINGIRDVQSDIHGLFQVLGTVYEGSGATALQQVHQNIHSQLDDMMNNMSTTGQQAQDQQDLMQHLDNQNAAAF